MHYWKFSFMVFVVSLVVIALFAATISLLRAGAQAQQETTIVDPGIIKALESSPDVEVLVAANGQGPATPDQQFPPLNSDCSGFTLE